MDREGVPDCDKCEAFEENPGDFVLQKICPICPWSRELIEPHEVERLLRMMALIGSGCPVGRHELRDDEWIWLSALRNERDKVIDQRREKKAPP
jgi:hypothetical protein